MKIILKALFICIISISVILDAQDLEHLHTEIDCSVQHKEQTKKISNNILYLCVYIYVFNLLRGWILYKPLLCKNENDEYTV